MIRSLTSLFRLRLALLNGVAAASGVLLFPGQEENRLLWIIFTGITLVAAGGSALNQAMEYESDRLMIRTRQRPVARGSMKPATAAMIGLTAITAGTLFLVRFTGILPGMVAGGGILWYLAVYTPLKRRTPYALAVGAVCGALLPIIGWCSAGGNIPDYRIMLLAGLIYLWQIPHFWLFQRRYAADYRAAGFPLLSAVTTDAGFSELFGLWIGALITAAMLLPAFGLISNSSLIWYAIFPLPLIIMTLFRSEKALFSYLNTFPLLIALALLAQ